MVYLMSCLFHVLTVLLIIDFQSALVCLICFSDLGRNYFQKLSLGDKNSDYNFPINDN